MSIITKIKNPELAISYYRNHRELVSDALMRPRPLSLIAMNVEKLMNVRKNPSFLSNHNSVIYYPDGQPITWFSKEEYPRLPGVEVWIELHKAAIHQKLNVLFIGAQKKVIEKTEQKLLELKLSDNVKFVDGYQSSAVYYRVIQSFRPDVVFVAMGSPKQEQFISQLTTRHKNAIYMGIGGSLDVFSGHKTRSPYFLRRLGLEFLYRLYVEPKRILRQYVYVYFVILFVLGEFRVKQ